MSTSDGSSSSGSGSSSAIMAREPGEEDTNDVKYESLRDMSPQNIPFDTQSCCSTEVEEEIHNVPSQSTYNQQQQQQQQEEEVIPQAEVCALELEQEAAILRSCEEEIRKYIEEAAGREQAKGQRSEEPGELIETTANGVCQTTESNSSQKDISTSTTTQTKDPKVHAATPQQKIVMSQALPDLPLEIGDHVYQWRSFAGCPGVFQHHGIVVNVGLDEFAEMELEIADFSCILRGPANGKTKTQTNKNTDDTRIPRNSNSIDMVTGNDDTSRCQGILRVYKSSSTDQKWHKVHYKASVWKTSLWRSGTCTCVDSDPPAKVLARTYFLLEHPEVLPSYHIFQSNCECVSVFCKTGSWSTLQASSLLSLTAAGQLKSTATLAAYAASQQITVQSPAAGVWGYLGYTTSTQVSLLSTQPHLIPLLAAYGVVTAGGPTFVLWRCQRFWEATAARLEDEFWKHAMKDPDIFAHSMMHWSERHKAFEYS